MTDASTVTMLTAFGGGIVASFSPCVYPLIPVTIAYFGTQADIGRKSKVMFYAFGQIIALIALGLVAVSAGEAMGFSSELPSVQIAMGVLLIVAGFFSFKGKLPGMLTNFNQYTSKLNNNRMSGAMGAILLGGGSALLMSPCTTPVLSAVLTTVATSKSHVAGFSVMAAYAVGFSLLLLLLGLGMLSLKSLPKSGTWLSNIHRIGAVAMVLFGLYYLWTGTQTAIEMAAY